MEIPDIGNKKTSLSEIIEEESLAQSRTCFQTVRNDNDGFFTAKTHFNSFDDLKTVVDQETSVILNRDHEIGGDIEKFNYKSQGNINKYININQNKNKNMYNKSKKE